MPQYTPKTEVLHGGYMDFPKELKYTKDHEWAYLETNNTVVVGITEYAANALGDIVFVELPRKNIDVEKGVSFGVIESVKAASDLYSPVTGLVVDVNYQLIDHPELINKAPYKAFLIKVEIKDKKELDTLMNDSEYAKYVEGLPK
jgi:glycine cleavage system H protein